MSSDAGALRAVAAALDEWADLVRAHAGRVGAGASATCWSSPAARAYAGRAVELAGGLRADADQVEVAAARFRQAADEVGP